MEKQELKQKNDKELRVILEDLRDDLRNFRFQASSRQLKTVQSIKKTKKAIAQILTELKKREMVQTESPVQSNNE